MRYVSHALLLVIAMAVMFPAHANAPEDKRRQHREEMRALCQSNPEQCQAKREEMRAKREACRDDPAACPKHRRQSSTN